MATQTLVFSEAESRVVDELAQFHELSKTQVMRQALRLYQAVHLKQQQGQQMAFVDKAGKVVRQVIIGMKVDYKRSADPAPPTPTEESK